jgi:pilus assembly protein CpaF
MEKFYLNDHLPAKDSIKGKGLDFSALCSTVFRDLMKEWEQGAGSMERMADIQKKAIIGYEKEVGYFLNRIRELIRHHQSEGTPFPSWYNSLEEAVYHENWGLAGVAEWFSESFRASSSAKIIGEDIFFLEEGTMRIKPQKITKERRDQLIRAFLLLTPRERHNKDTHEIYLLDGTRVTIFRGALVKESMDILVFRRYVIPEYTFEEQAARGTIPKESIPLFIDMVGLGYNIAFTGAMRTSKTTFLATWQQFENPNLEGLMIETDPEIPLHKLMPGAPVVQLLADQDRMLTITKSVLRSDADYLVIGEARDGYAMDTVVRVASKGTRRMKITFHTRNPMDFPYDAAWEIVRSVGGDLAYTAGKVAASFDYVFHFIQGKDKRQKRLSSIYEISWDRSSSRINMKEICRYISADHRWKWTCHIGEDKELAGREENPELFQHFWETLERLADELE